MLEKLGKQAKQASRALAQLDTQEKNLILKAIGDQLLIDAPTILSANEEDIKNASGLSTGLLDRLRLSKERLVQIKTGIDEIIALTDPIGEIVEKRTLPNGLLLQKQRVPIGVIGIIYESRPNVTIDTSVLAIKSGNAIILRGGKEAIASNLALVQSMQKAIINLGYDANIVQLITDNSYDTAEAFMRLDAYVDVLIPRGSHKLIQHTKKMATIPVIETGVGNCHIYVDDSADLTMALTIIDNAKTQRVGVCNAVESLLIHENISATFLPELAVLFNKKNVIVYADEAARTIVPSFEIATEKDYETEYLDYKCSLKLVKNIDEAIAHIDTYGTKHSEAIITTTEKNAEQFTKMVDAAAVYVNASTRFTDGHALGLGAEMGISTQKLHARGPIGLKEITSTKYIILGQGQTRP